MRLHGGAERPTRRKAAWRAGMVAVWTAVVGCVMSLPAAVRAQDVLLDRMLVVVNNDVITQSDVRAARRLGLVPNAARLTDDQLIDALIERRLELAEVARYSPAEPPKEQLAARRKEWEAALGGANVQAALASVGLTDAALTSWLRDDLRLAAYLDQRFTAAAQPTRQQAAAYFQVHQQDFAVNGVVPDFATIEAEVRRRVAADRRSTRIHDWIESLKQRAEIRRVGK